MDRQSHCSSESSDSLSGATTADDRTAPRKDYRYVQKVAPVRGAVMPNADDFFDVVCCDLSQGGVAFYLNTAPDFDEVIVALGRCPVIARFRAEVVHVEQVSVDHGARYRVGCRLVERLGL